MPWKTDIMPGDMGTKGPGSPPMPLRIILTGLLFATISLWVVRNTEAQPSPRRAFLFSLIMPGAGQYYVGAHGAARSFLSTEFGIWAGFTGFRTYAAIRENDYQLFARTHAGAHTGGKDETFLDDLGFYANVYEHNRFARWREGPEGQVYPETEEWGWEWDSDVSRRRYRRLRESSVSAERRAVYMVGVAMLNRIVSAVHAARIAQRLSAQNMVEEKFSPRVIFWAHEDELRLTLLHPL